MVGKAIHGGKPTSPAGRPRQPTLRSRSRCQGERNETGRPRLGHTGGLTFAQLAASSATGWRPDLLRLALADELTRGRVLLEGNRYRLNLERIDPETLTALCDLDDLNADESSPARRHDRDRRRW